MIYFTLFYDLINAQILPMELVMNIFGKKKNN